jgi:hypothetical protein
LIWQKSIIYFSTSKIALDAFIYPTLTSLLNLALTIGVVCQFLPEISCNNLQPSFNNTFRLEDHGYLVE